MPYGPGFQSPSRYESDLSNEALYALVGQEAAKILDVVFRGKKNCGVGSIRH